MVLMSFHALSSSWIYSNFEFRAFGVSLKTLLLLHMVGKVIGAHLVEIL